MRGFLLDTNVISEQIRPLPNAQVGAWMYAQPEESLFLSVVTIGELRKGLVMLQKGRRQAELQSWLETSLVPRFRGRILPISQAVAERWGLFSGERQIAGQTLALADGLIGATAYEHDLAVVTRNTKDFADLGLTLLNPWSIID